MLCKSDGEKLQIALAALNKLKKVRICRWEGSKDAPWWIVREALKRINSTEEDDDE